MAFAIFVGMETRSKKLIFSILLFTLMIFKVSSFHVYAHQDETENKIENCSICDIVSLNQENQFTTSKEIYLPEARFYFIPYIKNYESKVNTTASIVPRSFYCRPPPALT